MQFVDPIRSPKHITQIKNFLKWGGNIRDLLLFELWINSALRISDLLSIKVSAIFEQEGMINDFFIIKEGKTNKLNKIYITEKVKATLELYKKHYPSILQKEDNYIFFSKNSITHGKKAITRKMAWVLISKRCKEICGMKGNYGWHTLRKTRGYQARIKAIPLEIIQHKLNHSSMSITKRYLWITDDEVEKACRDLDL
jgi:integrase